MKKAKVMLAVLAVLAVVGGALAFKARTFNLPVTVYKCTTDFFTDNAFRTGCFVPSVIQNAHLTAPDEGVQVVGAGQVTTTECDIEDICTTNITFEGAE